MYAASCYSTCYAGVQAWVEFENNILQALEQRYLKDIAVIIMSFLDTRTMFNTQQISEASKQKTKTKNKKKANK